MKLRLKDYYCSVAIC